MSLTQRVGDLKLAFKRPHRRATGGPAMMRLIFIFYKCAGPLGLQRSISDARDRQISLRDAQVHIVGGARTDRGAEKMEVAHARTDRGAEKMEVAHG
jgi:hypothetical protein